MVGRFVNHQGEKENRLAARFGSISMMQEPIWVARDNRWQESFAVEMRSRTGFSGSPVTVYRTPYTSVTKGQHTEFYRLLGVNWGYINDETGENTWLNGVVPAWKILETLEVPALKDKHEEASQGIREAFRKRTSATQGFADNPPVVPPSSDANPTH
jgi:hypothetical protein